MNNNTCPYVKISDSEAAILEAKLEKMNSLTLDKFSFTATAHAQGVDVQTLQKASTSLSDQLTVPFLIFTMSFFLFIFLMSAVYFFHWKRYGMNSPIIKLFVPVYFGGLIILVLPLMYNLFF